MNTTAKVLFTGKSHTTSGPTSHRGAATASWTSGLPAHPAAEQLFASAWSACYLGVIELAAGQRKIKLPTHPAVDTEIEMNHDGNSFFLERRHRQHSGP